jgi:enamine deaminase RidA (YjgF/YER057c/UK114 family)
MSSRIASALTTSEVLARLRARGLELPSPTKTGGAYSPVIVRGRQGTVAAQFPIRDGERLLLGRVGIELTEAQGRAAAELAGLNVLAHLHAHLNGFERLDGLLHVSGHVASAPDFQRQPQVLDGASELFRHALGEAGDHTRSAFAPPRLPWDLSVELVVTFALRD